MCSSSISSAWSRSRGQGGRHRVLVLRRDAVAGSSPTITHAWVASSQCSQRRWSSSHCAPGTGGSPCGAAARPSRPPAVRALAHVGGHASVDAAAVGLLEVGHDPKRTVTPTIASQAAQAASAPARGTGRRRAGRRRWAGSGWRRGARAHGHEGDQPAEQRQAGAIDHGLVDGRVERRRAARRCRARPRAGGPRRRAARRGGRWRC